MDDSQRVDIAEEARLVRRVRWGDRRAFETLYHRHAAAIHALALRLTGSAAAAEDVTQDTFMQLLRFMDRMAPDRPLRPWLKRVAANAAIDRLRRERRFVALDEVRAVAPETDTGDAADDASLGLLQRFPPLVRTVVWLQVVEGWTHRELASRFGRSESWSKSIVARTLARMRDMIEVDE